MKSIWLIALALLVPTFAQANIEFRLSCEVKFNIIIAAEEGKTRSYTHYDGQFIVGDTLNFMAQLRPNYSLYMRLNDPLRDEIIAGTALSAKDIRYWNTEQMDYLSDEFNGYPSSFNIDGVDKITLDERILIQSPSVQLERYYKDDWHGIVSKNSGMEIQVAMLACRTVGRTELSEITDKLKSQVKKWNE